MNNEESMDIEDLTPRERQELHDFVHEQGSPTPEERANVHAFINKVANSKDTTKTGYLESEEIGTPNNPIRTIKELGLISDKLMHNVVFKDFFNAQSEIITSTSLSKNAKLIELAVISRRQLEDITKPKQKPKGFFKKNDEEQ